LAWRVVLWPDQAADGPKQPPSMVHFEYAQRQEQIAKDISVDLKEFRVQLHSLVNKIIPVAGSQKPWRFSTVSISATDYA
jgi:hypothetical protein